MEKPNINFTAMGGAAEIGANSFLFEFNGHALIIDSGLKISNTGGWDNMPDWNLIRNAPEAIIITHAHNDHIGSIVPLIAKYPHIPVYMTPATFDLLRIVLKDGAKHVVRSKEPLPYASMFDKFLKDEGSVFKHFNAVEYLKEFKIGDLTLKFRNAGHILGSAMVEISDGEYTVLHTGDFCYSKTFVDTGADISGLENKVDLLVSEATYGDSGESITCRESAGQKIVDAVNYAVSNKTGVLIPAFAIGKTQELLIIIEKLKLDKRIPENTPVYVAGLSEDISRVYKSNGYELEYKVFSQGDLDNKKKIINNIHESNNGTVLIMTSGFLIENTLSRHFFDLVKDDKSWTVLFPSTFAMKQLRELTENSECRIDCTDLSAHSKAVEIKNFIGRLNPEDVIFVHGDKSAVSRITRDIKEQDSGINAYYPENNGETVYMYGRKGKLFMEGSYYLDALIITVGTSLIGNYKKAHNGDSYDEESLFNFLCENPKKNSAEINTFLNEEVVEHKKKNKAFIFSSDTDEGKMCADAISRYISECDSMHMGTEIKVIKNLNDSSAHLFKTSGLSNLMSEIVKVITKFKDCGLIVTGGYKGATAYASLAGTLFGKKVYYQHEDFKTLITMPIIPLGLDFDYYKRFRQRLNAIVNCADLNKAKRIKKELPESFIDAFIEEVRPGSNDKVTRYARTPLGLLIEAVCLYRNKKSENKLSGAIIQAYNNTLSSARLELKNINSPLLRSRLESVLQMQDVKEVIFCKVKSFFEDYNLKNKLSKITTKKCLIMDRIGKKGELCYILRAHDYVQQVKITVSPGMENNVAERLGKEINLNE